MSSVPAPREYFLDSIRAWLMLLGIPFHISLIYSTHSWHVNSATPSWWLTLFNDFIHAFRMQVFFVISGYFSYMLFLRYPLKRWWKVRVRTCGYSHAYRNPFAYLAAIYPVAICQRENRELAYTLCL
ncbi:glucans biosynthesis protein [Salmonella enterica subsp. enterica]|uniref:Glucans biosynthesis protein n=1 Tax=Salmonella enterica I TaxID=59201 RepID=A0A379WW54_SALET|nr:glucans biosynthesis protein [Salmonella enterica subsp. enterica]